MRRIVLLALVLAMFAAACGGGDEIVIDDTPLAELLGEQAVADVGATGEGPDANIEALISAEEDVVVEDEEAVPVGPYADALTVLADYRATFADTGSFVMRTNEFSSVTAAINPFEPVPDSVSAYQNDTQVLVLQHVGEDDWMCGVIFADGSEHIGTGELASLDLAEECVVASSTES